MAGAGLDADDHFNGGGRAEGRNPNAFFDRAYWLQVNTDVAAAGVDPWLHYRYSRDRYSRHFQPFPPFSALSV